MIRVEPALDRRECFARWAVAQTPKVRTADHNAFSVPADLFTQAPEGILIGALVDGRPYVPVQDGEEPSGGDDDGPMWAEPGEALPPLPESAYAPDSTPLDYEFAPLEDAPASDDEDRDRRDSAAEEPAAPDDSDSSDSGGDEDQEAADGYPCDLCTRSFSTARGRRTHRRQTHPNRRS